MPFLVVEGILFSCGANLPFCGSRGLTSNNLVECVLAPPRVYLFLPCKQPKNLENAVNLKTFLKHVHGLL
jgi:hypothetical protein